MLDLILDVNYFRESCLCNIGHTRWPQKVSHYQMIKKSHQIVSKPVNEIRFIRQIKVSIKHYNIITWSIRYSKCDLLSELNNYSWPSNKRYSPDTVNNVSVFFCYKLA